MSCAACCAEPHVDTVIHENECQYPELREKQSYITRVVRTEEENFAKTIDGGMKIFADMLAGHKAKGKPKKLTEAERTAEIAKLEQEMKEASKLLEFEYAAVLRDRIIELRGGK